MSEAAAFLMGLVFGWMVAIVVSVMDRAEEDARLRNRQPSEDEHKRSAR